MLLTVLVVAPSTTVMAPATTAGDLDGGSTLLSVLTGTVRSAETMSGLPGALVTLVRPAPDSLNMREHVVATNVFGDYRIEGIEAGTYRLVVSADGFVSEWMDLVFGEADERNLDFVLHRVMHVTMTGTVVYDGTADPVAGAFVQFLPAVWPRSRGYAGTTTLPDGTYSVDVTAGAYFASVSILSPDSAYHYREYFDDAATIGEADTIVVSPMGPQFPVDFSVPNIGEALDVSIGGTVRDNSGQPVEGAFVRAHNFHNPYDPSYTGLSGANGAYEIMLDRYIQSLVVWAERPPFLRQFYDRKDAWHQADRIEVPYDNLSVTGVDFELVPSPTPASPFTISGTVTDTIGMGAYGEVSAYRVGTADAYYGTIDYYDGFGSYTIEVESAGVFYVLAWASDHTPAFYGGAQTSDTATMIEVNGVVTGIDIQLDAFHSGLDGDRTIEGVIRDQKDRPVPGAIVTFRDEHAELVRYTLTDFSGAYRAERMTTGTYRMHVDVVGRGAYDTEIIVLAGDAPLSVASVQMELAGVGIEEPGAVTPSPYEIVSYPNPFRTTSTVRFVVTAPERIRLVAYDVLGREVAKLVDGLVMPGPYDVRWTPPAAASGVYVYRLTGERGNAVWVTSRIR